MTNSHDATIEQVHLSGKDQQTQVRVDGTGHLTYKAFRLNQRDRLVLDFQGALVRVQERSLSSNLYPVRLVCIGQFTSNVARLVIETEEQLPYIIAASRNVVTVVFSPAAVAEPRVPPTKETFTTAAAVPPESQPIAAPHSVENSQEAKSLSESSMQSALAHPSHLGAEPPVPAAKERQPVQVQTEPAAFGYIPQPGEKNASKAHAVVIAAAQQPAVSATQTVSGYVLGPDDEILIHGIEAPEISDKPVLIGTNGNITLPLIGRVKADGLTVEQLEVELITRFKEFIQEPQISVTVTEFRSQPVSVFGAVTKPGVVQLRGRQTLYEVLSTAGGPRDTAGSILTVTRPRQSGGHQHEKMVAQILTSKGFEILLPLYSTARRWKDRTKLLSLPLFPCYVFLRGGLKRRLDVMTTPGIHALVSTAGQPAAIPADEIEAIRRVAESGARVEPHPFIKCGDRMRVKRGPLMGIEGILVRKKNLCRLVLSMEMLGKVAAVEIDAFLVERLNAIPSGYDGCGHASGRTDVRPIIARFIND